MTKIRVGDIVTLEMRVTSVASYASKDDPDGQQIQGKILPRGAELGWLVPQEVRFKLKEAKLKVGDSVYLDKVQSATGVIISIFHDEGTEINHLWVRRKSDGVMWTTTSVDVTRID